MTNRLFLAVSPPEVVRRRVRAALPAAELFPDGVRWTSPVRWHVTLRFLGDCEVPAVVAAMAAAELPTAEAVLGPGLGSFGRSVLHVPVHGLDELARTVTAATTGLGQPPQFDTFTGHLTIARVRRGTRLAAPARAALRSVEVAERFTVRCVELFDSRGGAGGPTYVQLAQWSIPTGADPC